MWNTENPEEAKRLNDLSDFQKILAHALDSLGGVQKTGVIADYLTVTARAVNIAVDAYLYLRTSGRTDASKLLVRPVLEAMFCSGAAVRKRGFVYRKLYSEWLNHKRMLRDFPDNDQESLNVLQQIKADISTLEPNYPFEDKEINVKETAQLAELTPTYEGSYRIYCNFTHGSMAAVRGAFNEMTDERDTGVLLWAVYFVLELLNHHLPVKGMPPLSTLQQKLPSP